MRLKSEKRHWLKVCTLLAKIGFYGSLYLGGFLGVDKFFVVFSWFSKNGFMKTTKRL